MLHQFYAMRSRQMLEHSRIITSYRWVICRGTCFHSGSQCSIWPAPRVRLMTWVFFRCVSFRCVSFRCVLLYSMCVGVRGCLLAAIMILDLKVTRCIHICDMHNAYARTIKWSATCSLAGVHVGRTERECSVHTWILCGTCAVTAHGSW